MDIRCGVMSPRKRYSFFIDPALAAGLKALKARDGMPEGEAIRRALVEFLSKKRIAPETQADRKRASTRSRS